MNKSSIRETLKSMLALILAMSLVPLSKVAVAQEFKSPRTVDQAKLVIEAGERRFLADFNTPTAEQDFVVLVEANVLTQLVDDPAGYLQYFRANRAELIKTAVVEGQPPLNWQLFLAQTFIKYKIEKTKATENPESFLKWLEMVTKNPYIEWASWKTWVAIIGVVLFVKNVAHGAMIAGPAAGSVNAFTNPVITPVNQKLAVIGLKVLGPFGMKLNSWLFDPSVKASASTAELAAASETIDSVRNMLEGKYYKMDAHQWKVNRKALYEVWNLLGFKFGLLPDAYRGGRNLHIDLVVLRHRDFAQAVTNSINAAEVQRQGVEGILDRMITKGAQPAAVEQAALEFYEILGEQVRLEREAPERSAELNPVVEDGKEKLRTLGATPEQVQRIFENYRNSFAFQRQASTMLAAQLLNDAMFSDTIEGARNLYEQMLKNTALNHMHGMLKHEVIEILEKMKFKIEVQQAEIKINTAARAKSGGITEKLKGVTGGAQESRVLSQPGSITADPAKTGEQRVREAVGRAGRR